MKEILCNIYKFEELSDTAKEKAREWFRDDEGMNFDIHVEYVTEDAKNLFSTFGVDILDNGRNSNSPAIYYDLYHGGCSFSGYYSYKKGGLKAIKAAAPNETNLHSIADRLQKAQSKCLYSATANISPANREYSVSIEVNHVDSDRNIPEAIADDIAQALRELTDWILSKLRQEEDYINTDEYADENITANEYDFTIDGKFWTGCAA